LCPKTNVISRIDQKPACSPRPHEQRNTLQKTVLDLGTFLGLSSLIATDTEKKKCQSASIRVPVWAPFDHSPVITHDEAYDQRTRSRRRRYSTRRNITLDNFCKQSFRKCSAQDPFQSMRHHILAGESYFSNSYIPR